MNGVPIAVGAKLFDFQPPRCITANFCGGVARDAGRSRIRIAPAFGTFKGDDDSDAFGHG